MWLSEHHATARGIWVTTFKERSGKPYVSVEDLIDEALAHGWVDSRPRLKAGDAPSIVGHAIVAA